MFCYNRIISFFEISNDLLLIICIFALDSGLISVAIWCRIQLQSIGNRGEGMKKEKLKMKFYQKWQACAINENEKSDYFSATVPGNVQRDYAEYLGILDDLQFGNNVAKLEKTESFYWEYRTEIHYEAKPDEKIYFVAEGIDYKYSILLNENEIYFGEGIYTPVRIDITDKVYKGSVLKVLIHPHPKKKGVLVRSREEAAASCKPPVHYGWDWNPRLLISGFWMPAYIETVSEDSILFCEPHYVLNAEGTAAKLHFDIKSGSVPKITVIDPDGKKVYCGTDTDFELRDIRLWWCNGQGEAALYSYQVCTGTDMKEGTIGFRTVSLVMNAGTLKEPSKFPKDEYPLPITIELNGRRIFAKGSNYVNPDIFSANTTAELNRELVKFAAEANMNIFRMWGGAGIAKPEFYDFCDAYGIMVWQEFPLACNNYEGDSHYLSVLGREASSIITSLRRHPCHVLWCGGNELFNGWSGMSDQSLPLRLLNKICYELDSSKPFIMTSPRCGMGHGGYTFLDDSGEVYNVFQSSSKTAYTEFGVPSVTSLDELKKIIPQDEMYPINPTESWVAHHGMDALGHMRWVCLDVLEHYFGKMNSIEEIINYSSWLQCEGYKAAFEEGRRQWPHCSMTINWCYNEPWITAARNSIIGYPNLRKPAYYAVKSALRPTVATARIPKFTWNENEKLSFELWYHNDNPFAVEDAVNVEIELGGKKYELLTWNVCEVSANSNKPGPTVNFILPVADSAKEVTIRLLTAGKNADNSYRLLYRCSKTSNAIREMNT